ncbi:MAG: Shedu anti-phage system protein SduA domain-containing protein [archaeon]
MSRLTSEKWKMDINEFIKTSSFEEIYKFIERLSQEENNESLYQLKAFLLAKEYLHPIERQEIPRLVSRALLIRGIQGLNILIEAIKEAPGVIYPTAIIETLWYASKGVISNDMLAWEIPAESVLMKYPSKEVQENAKEAFDNYILECRLDEHCFDILINFMHSQNFINGIKSKTEANIFRKEVIKIFSESNIKISLGVIEAFANKIDKNLLEEEYHKYFATHPVLIDPLAQEVLSKKKLGVEFITDFVLRRLDNEYILVEIEKPQSRIFNKQNDFSFEFVHSLGQVLDFQEWVETHAEYARSLLPGISSPKGILIIGRRSELSPTQETKLKRFAITCKNIEIYTFDDLLNKAKNLYRNILREN